MLQKSRELHTKFFFIYACKKLRYLRYCVTLGYKWRQDAKKMVTQLVTHSQNSRYLLRYLPKNRVLLTKNLDF